MRFHPPLRQQAISVCWSNGATVIVHKPAGVATQEVPALLNAQLGREAGAPVWLPHRIDKFTRGLQVVTLSKAACSALNRSSEQRRWRKEYRALACLPRDAAARRRSPLFGCDGRLLRSGWLVSGIARRPLQPTPTEPLHPYIPNSMLFRATGLRCVVDAEPSAADMPAVEGAWACTQFALRHASESHAIYDLSLLTGRTHQIRVHFAAAGLPLAHDFYYNEESHHLAETYRYRGAAALPGERWAEGSPLPPPPQPLLWLHPSKVQRVPWPGRAGSPPLTPAASEGAIAEPLPQARELGLQACSLRLPVPEPEPEPEEGCALSGREEGVEVRLPLPEAWRAALGLGEAAEDEEAAVVRPWAVPDRPPPLRLSMKARRKRRRRRRQQGRRGLVVLGLPADAELGCLAELFAGIGRLDTDHSEVKPDRRRGGALGLLHFRGDGAGEAAAAAVALSPLEWRGQSLVLHAMKPARLPRAAARSRVGE